VLRPYSTGTGESFLPARAFTPGERVNVSALVRIRARSASASSTFTIARQAHVSQAEFPIAPGEASAVQRFASAPTLTPPTLTLDVQPRRGATGGYLLLAPYQGGASAGPMIADQQGRLVWFDPLPSGEQASGLSVQRYRGRPVLAWWQGRILQLGFGEGEGVLVDSSYRRVATVRAGNGYSADLHELRITPQGTAWIDAFDPVEEDLSSAHGATHGVLNDSVVQEIDLATGLVMWEWHALGHIAIGESLNPPQRSEYPWDFAHVNSIDPGPRGDVLLSARNTWALYDVDVRSGGIRWRLGGRHSTFELPPRARFYWQHDARFQPGGAISLFDNGSDPPEERQSRGLLLRLDAARRTVTLARAYANPLRTLLSESQGNMLALGGGNWLLGYGRLPDFTEFDAAGHLLLDGALPRGVQSFKTELAPWSGHPPSPPALLVRRSGSVLSAAVSWNGATDVASWRLLGGSQARLRPLATVARSGFETAITVAAGPRYLAVQALDRAGRVIGASAPGRAP
jgi:hypothetical protein